MTDSVQKMPGHETVCLTILVYLATVHGNSHLVFKAKAWLNWSPRYFLQQHSQNNLRSGPSLEMEMGTSRICLIWTPSPCPSLPVAPFQHNWYCLIKSSRDWTVFVLGTRRDEDGHWGGEKGSVWLMSWTLIPTLPLVSLAPKGVWVGAGGGGWKTYLTIWLVKAEVTGKGCGLAMPGLFFPSKALQQVKTNINC